MEDRNLEKALELISDLIQGEENPVLYEEYISNSEVYRLTAMIAKKMGLSIYEYQNQILFLQFVNQSIFQAAVLLLLILSFE